MNTISCLIGLGNPGQAFENTRHNIGKRFVHWLVGQHAVRRDSWKKEKLLWHTKILLPNQKEIVCILPQTYMNESGKIIPHIKTYFNESSQLLVVHDDLELVFGLHQFRFLKDRGLRGHNGSRSIQEHLFSKDKPYFLSLGIGRPVPPLSVADYVLQKFSFNEEQQMEALFKKAEQQLCAI